MPKPRPTFTPADGLTLVMLFLSIGLFLFVAGCLWPVITALF